MRLDPLDPNPMQTAERAQQFAAGADALEIAVYPAAS